MKSLKNPNPDFPCECEHLGWSHEYTVDENYVKQHIFNCQLCPCGVYKAMNNLKYMKWHREMRKQVLGHQI